MSSRFFSGLLLLSQLNTFSANKIIELFVVVCVLKHVVLLKQSVFLCVFLLCPPTRSLILILAGGCLTVFVEGLVTRFSPVSRRQGKTPSNRISQDPAPLVVYIKSTHALELYVIVYMFRAAAGPKHVSR